jgi:hypothetical protein
MNIPGYDLLSGDKKNSDKRIVLPTLPLKIVSPSFGFINLIFSFILYFISSFSSFSFVVVPPAFTSLLYSLALLLPPTSITSLSFVAEYVI